MSLEKEIDPCDYNFRLCDLPLGMQNLLIAIGALVMMPMLTGLDPSVALLSAGVGTLLFQLVTRGKVPVFLGSSFAFLPAMIFGTAQWGTSAMLGGVAFCGLAYFLLALFVRFKGLENLERLLPPIVTGPVIIAIGLILAPIAVNMASGLTGDGSVRLYDSNTAHFLAFISLASALLVRLWAKGWLQLMPLLVGIIVGAVASMFLGVMNWSLLSEASWFAFPTLIRPTFNWSAALLLFPIAVISAVEHVGDILAIGAITGRRYIADPGLHRTLLGDGLATTLAGLIGGPPNTTYSEVTAGVAVTKAYNPALMTWAALLAVCLSCFAKFGALLQMIPSPVMGGIMILLFGTIAVVGINILMEHKVDLMSPRAMTIAGIILIIPVGGMTFSIGEVELGGIGLGGILGVLLNLILPEEKDHSQVATA